MPVPINIYKWHPIYSFLSELSSFIEENPDAKIEINFFGANMSAEIRTHINKKCHNIIDIVHFFP